MEEQYHPQTIEPKIQQAWQNENEFEVTEDLNKEKFYCLTMFPYPSGQLHMGHVRVYTIGDVISRYQTMLGKNVLQPMGWDAFGLPAENAAIKNKIAPAVWTKKNIKEMRQQMERLGLGYDWRREITTCDPDYYRFEQWFFIQLYKKGLAYKKNAEVNWDPVDQTVLANEQVENGRGWRSGALVERKEISQWFLKITAYADELLNDLEKLDGWPQQVKTMQRNWIGRSEGVIIRFNIENSETPLSIYTTRPDTLYGVTYLAIAPQHPLCQTLSETNLDLQKFIAECKNIKTAEEDIATMEKKGLNLGVFATHPLTQEKIPVWVANFVLMEYGEGALMAVPAHDERDFEFAQKYHLPIKPVVIPSHESSFNFAEKAYTDTGELINSDTFTGLNSESAKAAIIALLENKQLGNKSTQYRLRDWGISRQRYWGAPIPIINCEHCGTIPVAEKDLPVLLPEEVAFSGVSSPLKNMPEFYHTTCPECGKDATRETDTFDTFLESSWYYARFTCSKQKKSILDGRANYWLPVDQYVGGIEHAVLHLLYARFFHKLLRDEGFINSDEPFLHLLSQGMVLNQGAKMSKSLGNIVDPNALIQKYGADTVRLFMMFAAPPSQNLEWSDSGVEGAHRFLKRLWAFAYEHRQIIMMQNRLHINNDICRTILEKADGEQVESFRQIYDLVSQIKFDYERQQYNTVVSGAMKILNILGKLNTKKSSETNINDLIIQKSMSLLLRLLYPITPHITQQLWEDLHYEGGLIKAEWPKNNAITFKIDTIEYIVQINGKLRAKVKVPASANQEMLIDIVKDEPKIKEFIHQKTIKKIITVPQKLINIVIGD